MADVVIIDVQTGERVERDFTPEELAQREADVAAVEAAAAAVITAQAQAAQDRLDAIEHAKSLGFTDAMIQQMFPALGDPNE